MRDSSCGACVVLDIEQYESGPDAASLRAELGDLVAHEVSATGADARSEPAAAVTRLVLHLPRRSSDHAVVDQLMDRLADSLGDRNRGVDLSERLRVTAAVDVVRPSGSPAVADGMIASPVLARVLEAARTSSVVIAMSESWCAGTHPAGGSSHVRSGADSFWVRVPGRTAVPGLVPVDLVPQRRTSSPGSSHHLGNRGDDLSIKIVVGSPGTTDGVGDDLLSGRQAEKLRLALVKAYPSSEELALMLGEKLGRNLARHASPSARLDVVVHQLIHRARTEGWIGQLVTAAHLGNPGNPTLSRLVGAGLFDDDYALRTAIEDPTGSVQQHWPQAGLLADLVAGGGSDPTKPWTGTALERIFRRTAAFQDVLPFTAGLLAAAGRVCSVRAGSSGGTGFLVGADLVLTNHHVVQDLIDGAVPPADARCVFDHHVRADRTVREGDAFPLAHHGDWMVAASPPSDVDGQDRPSRLPTTDELDYALIRLAEPAGLTRSPDGRERGWMRMAGHGPAVAAGLPLLILQHPGDGPLKLAVDHEGVQAVNANRTRMRHRVNTESGSSGSPCLTFDLELVALHHAGGPHHNESIPISTILAHLGAEGRGALGDT